METWDCPLRALTVAEAGDMFVWHLKPAGSADTLGTARSAQLASDVSSFPLSRRLLPGVHIRLFLIDLLTRGPAWAGKVLLGVCARVCALHTHSSRAVWEHSTDGSNPQSIFKQNQNDDLEGTEKPDRVLSACHLSPSSRLHGPSMLSTCKKNVS